MRLNTGHSVVQIRLVMHAVATTGIPAFESFLAYVQRFDVVPQTTFTSASGLSRGCHPDPVSKMYVLKRSTRANGTRMGGIIPLSHLRAPADLITRFFQVADARLTKESSLEYGTEFLLNDFFTKDLYPALQRRGH
jgi:hypothetical protein